VRVGTGFVDADTSVIEIYDSTCAAWNNFYLRRFGARRKPLNEQSLECISRDIRKHFRGYGELGRYAESSAGYRRTGLEPSPVGKDSVLDRREYSLDAAR
jgi:hypothetical protein